MRCVTRFTHDPFGSVPAVILQIRLFPSAVNPHPQPAACLVSKALRWPDASLSRDRLPACNARPPPMLRRVILPASSTIVQASVSREDEAWSIVWPSLGEQPCVRQSGEFCCDRIVCSSQRKFGVNLCFETCKLGFSASGAPDEAPPCSCSRGSAIATVIVPA